MTVALTVSFKLIIFFNIYNNKDTYKQRSLKKTQMRCRHMSFSAAEQVCLQVSCKSCRRQWRKTHVGWWTVPNVWTRNSKVPATDGCGCPWHTQFAGGSRPQMPTWRPSSLTTGWPVVKVRGSGGGAQPPAPIWPPCNSMSPPDWIYKVLFYA